jgi:hypothetical protein
MLALTIFSPDMRNYVNLLASGSVISSFLLPSMYVTYFQAIIIGGSALLGLVPIFLVSAMGSLHDIEKETKYKHIDTVFGLMVLLLFILVFVAIIQSFSGLIYYGQFTSNLANYNKSLTFSITQNSIGCSSTRFSNYNFTNECNNLTNESESTIRSLGNSFYSLYYAFGILFLLMMYYIMFTFVKRDTKAIKDEKKDSP